MKLKLDENLPSKAAHLLADAGHDASSVIAQDMQGTRDDALIETCTREERALVTLDLDFADIQRYPPARHAGLIVLRLADQSAVRVLEIMSTLVECLESQDPRGRLWILEKHRLRIRE